MKKFFEGIGLFALVIFSFLGTHQLATVIMDSDDIMQQIKEVNSQYEISPVNATIKDNTMIPGISGSIVDIKASYKKMKKIDSFNSNLLVYKKILPDISIKGDYNKYIISGNKSQNNVGLLFLVDNNDNVDKILDLLKNNKATFFIDGYWFENNNSKISELIDKGYTIGNLGYNHDYNNNGVVWMNTIVTKIGKQKDTYCYNEEDNKTILDICSLNKSYTIKPNIIAKGDPFITIKNNLVNGSIISLEINDTTLKQLPLIIDFIKSKGFNIVNLEEMLNE